MEIGGITGNWLNDFFVGHFLAGTDIVTNSHKKPDLEPLLDLSFFGKVRSELYPALVWGMNMSLHVLLSLNKRFCSILSHDLWVIPNMRGGMSRLLSNNKEDYL